MYITVNAEKLRMRMAQLRIGPTELARKVTAMEKLMGKVKKPMTVQSYFHYNHNLASPPSDRQYAIAAILNVNPKVLFELKCDKDKLQEFKKLCKQI